MGGWVAGAPTPLICPLLLLGPGHCSRWWAQGHPGHQTQGQGPRSCLCLPVQFISTPAFGPFSPSGILVCPLRGQNGWRAEEELLQCSESPSSLGHL